MITLNYILGIINIVDLSAVIAVIVLFLSYIAGHVLGLLHYIGSIVAHLVHREGIPRRNVFDPNYSDVLRNAFLDAPVARANSSWIRPERLRQNRQTSLLSEEFLKVFEEEYGINKKEIHPHHLESIYQLIIADIESHPMISVNRLGTRITFHKYMFMSLLASISALGLYSLTAIFNEVPNILLNQTTGQSIIGLLYLAGSLLATLLALLLAGFILYLLLIATWTEEEAFDIKIMANFYVKNYGEGKDDDF